MRLRITRTLGVRFFALCISSDRSEFSVEENFYAQLLMVVDSCPKGDDSDDP